MIDILDGIKVDHIWSNNLFSQKSIAIKLGIWNNLSEEEKSYYERITPYEAHLNGKDFNLELNESVVYGEITKNGVFELNKHIKSNGGVFYDIGSGNGKLILQMAVISEFDKYVGIEIEKIRYLYSVEINKQIELENVNFINEDVLNVEISDASFVFINDIMFSEEMRTKILNMIPSKCFFTSVYDFDNCELIDNIELEVSWMEKKVPFKIWKKK